MHAAPSNDLVSVRKDLNRRRLKTLTTEGTGKVKGINHEGHEGTRRGKSKALTAEDAEGAEEILSAECLLCLNVSGLCAFVHFYG